jgi:membrane associated rhomboid family serine protease
LARKGHHSAMTEPVFRQSPEVAPEGGSQPMFFLPRIVVMIALGLIAIHVARQFLSSPRDFFLLLELGFMPGRLSVALDPAALQAVVAALPKTEPADLGPELAKVMVGDGDLKPWSLLTYGALHGSLSHLVTNLIWFVVFGAPVCERMGTGRFLALVAVTLLGGSLAHWLANPYDLTPMIGFSTTVSGVTAAAATFMFGGNGIAFANRENGRSLIRLAPRSSLIGLMRNSRALIFIGVWFAMNLLFGTGLVPVFGEETSVAWQAHIGGFVAGFLVFMLLDEGVRGL